MEPEKHLCLKQFLLRWGGLLAGIGEVRGVHFSTDEIRRENELLGDGSNTIKYKTPVKVECDLKIEEEALQFCSSQKKSVKRPKINCRTERYVRKKRHQ